MKKLNEIKPVDEMDDVFEVLDMEEKLDYEIWGDGSTDCCNGKCGQK